MKKFISVALVASMVASMGVTAFAADDYDAKDKDLEFHSELLYDGKGADELWLPIVVNKNGKERFITDSSTSVQDIANEMNDKMNEANLQLYNLGRVLGINLQTIKPENDPLPGSPTQGKPYGMYNEDLYTGLTDAEKIAKLNEYLAEELPKYDLPVLEVSTVAFNGDSYNFEDYRNEARKTYAGTATAPLASIGGLTGSYKQILKFLGAEFKPDGSVNTDASGDPILDTDLEPVEYDRIEDVDDVEVEWKAKRGGTLVSDIYIDEVDDLGGIYCVVFELNDNLKTAVDYLTGTLRMESGKNREIDEQDIRYNYYNKAAYTNPEYQQTIGDLNGGFEVDGTDNYINLVDFNDRYTIAFFKKNVDWVEMEDNNGFYFEVDVAEQGKVNLIYNNEAIDAVTDVASEDAVLTFYNFEARPIFDFAGKVTITPPEEYDEFNIEDLHVYTYEKDGSLKEVKQAKVGEDGDTIEFRTNVLGKFVLSSEELELKSDEERAALEALKEAEANGETVEGEGTVADEDGKTNPGTGL